MAYTKFEPSTILKPYIAFYYIWERDDYLMQPEIIMGQANSTCVLVFNYGDRYLLYNHACEGMYLPKIFLSGFSLSPFKLRLTGKISMLGVVFKGLLFSHLFRKIPPLKEIHDRRIDFELIVGRQAGIMNEKLESANSNKERINIVNQYFEEKVTSQKCLFSKNNLIIDFIEKFKGMIRMDNMAEIFELSPRQMRRVFKEETGIGPKFFARLKRFNYVNKRLSEDPSLSWFDFIDSCEYYDQSHFIKEYQEFTGVPPGIFLENLDKTRKPLTQIESRNQLITENLNY